MAPTLQELGFRLHYQQYLHLQKMHHHTGFNNNNRSSNNNSSNSTGRRIYQMEILWALLVVYGMTSQTLVPMIRNYISVETALFDSFEDAVG